jgi:hypothetical protein
MNDFTLPDGIQLGSTHILRIGVGDQRQLYRPEMIGLGRCLTNGHWLIVGGSLEPRQGYRDPHEIEAAYLVLAALKAAKKVSADTIDPEAATVSMDMKGKGIKADVKVGADTADIHFHQIMPPDGTLLVELYSDEVLATIGGKTGSAGLLLGEKMSRVVEMPDRSYKIEEYKGKVIGPRLVEVMPGEREDVVMIDLLYYLAFAKAGARFWVQVPKLPPNRTGKKLKRGKVHPAKAETILDRWEDSQGMNPVVMTGQNPTHICGLVMPRR